MQNNYLESDSSLYRNYYRQAYQYPIKKYEKVCKINYKTESRNQLTLLIVNLTNL